MATEKTGQGGAPIDLHKGMLNPNEARLIGALLLGGVQSIADLAAAFPDVAREKAHSCVRNALRRLVRGRWVTHGETIGDGMYRLTSLGAERWDTVLPQEEEKSEVPPPPIRKKKEQPRRASPAPRAAKKAKAPKRDGRNLQQKADAFRSGNPDIYRELVALAKKAKAAGVKRVGMGTLYEVLRWEQLLAGKPVQLNNSHRSRMARFMMKAEPALAYLFQNRELKST